MPDANPLPPCPDSPNCARATRHYHAAPDALFAHAQDALADLSPAELRAEARRAQAVYRVLFFKDDVEVAVTPGRSGADGGGPAVHIRSASRTGSYDFGVNARRVERFFRALEKRLGV